MLGLVFVVLGAGVGTPKVLGLKAQGCGGSDWVCLPLRGVVTVTGAGSSSRAAQGSLRSTLPSQSLIGHCLFFVSVLLVFLCLF